MGEEIPQTVGASHLSDGLEAIAYMLFLETWLDMDETIADLSDDVLRSLGAKWKNEWLPMKNSDHCGDCTKVPATCIRCVLDDLYSQASRIAAANAKLRRPPETDEVKQKPASGGSTLNGGLCLFKQQNFVSHAGVSLDWKIDCDALTDGDLETLAWLAAKSMRFGSVYGIPTGGIRLATALERYCTTGPRLLVDDVLTTGGSMERERKPGDVGVVIFARGFCPDWVSPIFWLNTAHMDNLQAKLPAARPLAEAQETLCTACAKHFAWCKADPTFSSTSDAVVACNSFEAARLVGWKCYFCDYRGNGQYDTFCGNCRRHK